MATFKGFPEGKIRLTPIPASFFSELLPAIDHLGELKLILYVFWKLDHMEGTFRYVRRSDLSRDSQFMKGMEPDPEKTETILDETLERVVTRGVLLKAIIQLEKGQETLYFLNSPKGRAAVQAIQSGKWRPSGDSQLPVELALERPNIFQLYEQHIGPLTPMMAEALQDAEQTYPEAWIEEAMRIAVENNVRRWRYVEAILRSWKEEDAMSKIEETLKKIADATSKGNIQNLSSIDSLRPITAHDLPGDPNCPICSGVGYLRLDVPVGHPDFGKLQVCTCRRGQIDSQMRQRLYVLSNLDELRHLTFENFQPRGRIGLSPFQADSLELAYNQAHHFAQTLKGWLLLQGGYGCGKTHLIAAIANFAVSLGVPTLFITVPDLLDSLRFAYDDPESTFEERFEEIRHAPLLVLDDFGTQNATPWAQEKLFQILNYRYINRLPLVLTTNLSLEEIEERIRSRLLDPDLVTNVTIQAPDYRRPADDIGHPELSSLALHSQQTFKNFDDRRGEGIAPEHLQNLDKAIRVSSKYAKNPVGWMVFTGAPGCGKTHLAASIANYRAELGHLPLFVSVPDLLDHLRATFAPGSSVRYDRRFDEVKTARLLILDGLGSQSATPWAREKLSQLLDFRYNAKLPTIITMTKTVEDLEQSEPHLVSRMLDRRLCTLFAITAPAFRGAPRKEAKAGSRSRR